MESMPNEFVIAQLDFTNAFNNLRRDTVLEAVYKTVSDINKFCHLSYFQPTKLRYGSRSISSEEGTLLFCITIQLLLHMLRSELFVGYIDDITIGGHISTVDDDVTIIRHNGPSLGLHLSITKCALISSIMPVQPQSLNEFIAVSPPDASLLGAPLFRGLYRMLL